jgi:alkylation response protein AidB-like acyl-CoA dehydrogenase
MDFSTTDDQKALVALATRILGERATPKRLQQLETDGEWLDLDLWRTLADAGIAGAALPEEHGGSGLGYLDLVLLLEQVGAHVAPVPLFETVLTAALPIARFGTDEQKARDLPGVAAGTSVLTAALNETGRDDLSRPLTTAVVEGQQVRLNGTKSGVPLAAQAVRVLVPASLADGRVVLALLDPAADGVSLRPQTSTNGQPQSELELADAVGELLVGPDEGADALAWLLDRAQVGLAAMALGVSARALAMSATYTTGRVQFGRPIATFQAVGHRLADAYIDVEGMRLTTLQAAWLLDADLPGRDEARVAKWWAAEGGHRVAHATQHVHGGMGVDVEYPLSRYFRWSKHLEFALGSAQVQLLSLGASLAAEPV